MENVTDNTTKDNLRKDPNEIMKIIHQKIKELDEKQIGKSSKGNWKQ